MMILTTDPQEYRKVVMAFLVQLKRDSNEI
jgi:hypothetical protein